MRTPTTIEALEGAIEMLKYIRENGTYTYAEFIQRLNAYEAAAFAHREQEMKDEQRRAGIRALAMQRRSA